MKTLSQLFEATLFVLVAAILFVAVLSYRIPGMDMGAYIIMSGSMEPAIKTGSVAFTHTAPFYTVGDVVTFEQSGRKGTYVTHRIVGSADGDVYYKDRSFTTKGDANDNPDSGAVAGETVRGKVFLSVPYLGYVAHHAKTPQGFILLVVVPATIIIYEELKSLVREVAQKIRRVITLPDGRPGHLIYLPLALVFALLPVAGGVFVRMGIATSFFSDIEKSYANILGAASSYASPTPTGTVTPTPEPGTARTLVIHEVMPDPTCTVGQNKPAQWIEVYNGYDTTVNLQNFRITDGTSDIALVNAGNINLPPDSFALLSHDTAVWQQCFSDNGTATANLGGTLEINTGSLDLKDSGGTVIDAVRWGSAYGLTPATDESIERTPKGRDTATGSDFEASDFTVRSPSTPGGTGP